MCKIKERSLGLYDNPPLDFNATREIAACYSRFEDKYLLLQRSENSRHQPNVWGVPGGKVKVNETHFEANLREFHEETGIHLDPEKVSFFKTIYIRDPEFDFVFHMYTYDFSDQPIVTLCPDEHQSFAWETFENSIKMPLIWGEVEAFEILCQAREY